MEGYEGSWDDYRGIPMYESGACVNGVVFDPYEALASIVVVLQTGTEGMFQTQPGRDKNR